MPNRGQSRAQRLRRSKAQLIEELERLERQMAALQRAGTPPKKAVPNKKPGGGDRSDRDLLRLAGLPTENPNPVLTVGAGGELLYANEAARAITGLLKGRKKNQLHSDIPAVVADVQRTARTQDPEIRIGDHVLALSVTPVPGEDYVNIYGRDVTERRRAEAALRDSREMLYAVIDAVPAMISAKDCRSRYIFINRYQAELYGVSRDEAIGKTAGMLLGRRYGDRTRKLDRKVLDSGEALAFYEEDHVDAHGMERPLLATKVPLKDEDGAVRGVVTVALDITDRKGAEQALRDSETRFRQATRLASLGHWAWDEIEDRCTYCSQELARIHGVSVEDYIATVNSLEGDLSRVHPEDREQYNRTTRESWGDQDTYDIAYRIIRPDGELRHVRELAEVVRDRDGRAVRAIGTKQDITLPKRTEEALREKTEFLELNQVITRAANEAASVEEAMQTALDRVCAHIGWPTGHLYLSDEATGDMVSTGIWHGKGTGPFATFQRASEGMRFPAGVGLPGRVLATGEPAWIADLTKDSNFPRAPLAAASGIRAAAAFPLLGGKDVLGLLEFFSTTTVEPHQPLMEVMAQIGTQLGRVVERTRAQSQLVAAKDEALRATEAKSRFLANMSHELRTPMNAIIGFTRLVMRRSRDDIEPKQYDNLEKVLSSAERLLLLINDVLDLSKIEAGQLTLVPSSFDLDGLIDDCLRTVEPMVDGTRVSLEREVAPGIPQIVTDEEKMWQIILNLLSNSIKFTDQGAVTLRAVCRDEALVIEVADTGIGIPEDALALIFEEFGQSADGSARRYGGTGLGLSITRHLVQFLGGAISVESAVGAGSTFTVALPLSKLSGRAR